MKFPTSLTITFQMWYSCFKLQNVTSYIDPWSERMSSHLSKQIKMMMMMMMMNSFCDMLDRRKAFILISSRDHCQRSTPTRISDTPRAGFEPTQNLSSCFVQWSCLVVITTRLALWLWQQCYYLSNWKIKV